MKIVVTKSAENGQFYPKFVGKNGEDWFWAEGYTTKSSAVRSVGDFVHQVSLLANALDVEFVEED